MGQKLTEGRTLPAPSSKVSNEKNKMNDDIGGWYVYILECRDKSLYTGITTDPFRRLDEHNRGKGAKYTRSRAPCKLLRAWEVMSRSEALQIEAKIKAMPRKKKLEVVEWEFLDRLKP